MVENITYTPEVNIHDNVFKETPTRGILVTTRKKVTIENNLFDGMGMAGIYISNDAQSWYESGPTRDVTIRGNTFRRSGSDAILVEPTNPTVSTTDTVHKNMTIEGNTFYVNGNRVLNAKSVSDLTFRDNKIYRENPDDTVTLGGDADVALAVGDTRRIDATASVSQVSGSRLFRLNGCKQVVFGGNTYDVGVKAGIDLANMGASEVNVSDDSAKVGADGLVPVTGSIAYVSDDAAVASVDQDGTITAVGEGETTVRTYVIAGARRMPGSVVNVRVSASTATAPTPGTSADPLDGHPSSVATLSSATIDGLSKSFDFKPGTLYYFGADSALTARAAFKATDADASVKATLNGKAIDAKGKNVLVIGGGDTGNDCQGTALRQGCTDLVALEMMPQPPKERAATNPWPEWPRVLKVDYGQTECLAKFNKDPRIYQTTVKEFLKDDAGNLTGAVISYLKPERDPETGRTRMVPTGEEFTYDCQLAFIAAGFTGCESYVADAFGVDRTPRGNVADQNFKTNVDKVFVCGDMRRGQSLVVWGLREGRDCAAAVDRYLMGYTNL